LDLPNQWLWEIIDEFIYQVSVLKPFCFVTDAVKQIS
jgi:hypothetical protein